MDGDVLVGRCWLAKIGDQGVHEWFMYDVVIAQKFRGRGFGRSTMQAAEGYVGSQGGTKFTLNVFGPHPVARGLYESIGYSVLAVGARKNLN